MDSKYKQLFRDQNLIENRVLQNADLKQCNIITSYDFVHNHKYLADRFLIEDFAVWQGDLNIEKDIPKFKDIFNKNYKAHIYSDFKYAGYVLNGKFYPAKENEDS